MIKTLFRVQLASAAVRLKNVFIKDEGKSLFTRILLGVLILYLVAASCAMSGMLFSGLCTPLSTAGLNWLYFAMVVIAAAAVMFFGSLFFAWSQVFEGKDNELLLSMPVRPSALFFVRMAVLYGYCLILGMLICLPALYVYITKVPDSLSTVLAAALTLVFLPFPAMALSLLAGGLISFLTRIVKHKAFFTFVFYLAFLALYFYAYGRAFGYIQKLLSGGDALADVFSSKLPPLWWLASGIVQVDLMKIFLSLCVFVLPALLLFAVLIRFFVPIAIARKGVAKVKYRKRRIRSHSAGRALLYKELRHLSVMPLYLLNGAMGVVLIIAATVFMLIRWDFLSRSLTALSSAPGWPQNVSPAALFAAALCFLSSMNMLTASSVSLEGKTLWIVQSLPLSPREILMAKVRFQLWICLPPVFLAATAGAIILKANALQILLLFLLPTVCNFVLALTGICVNLKFPRLDWNSEITVIKQSASSAVGMLLNLALVILPMAGYVSLSGRLGENGLSAELYAFLLAAVYLILAGALYRYLCTAGSRRFSRL